MILPRVKNYFIIVTIKRLKEILQLVNNMKKNKINSGIIFVFETPMTVS
jgi:hypothetical protein